MRTRYDGQQIVGMDLHRNRSVLVSMTADGQTAVDLGCGPSGSTIAPRHLRKTIARGPGAEGRAGGDWRSDYDAHRYEVAELPSPVRESLVRMHQRLGLVFGACDPIRTPEDEWVFLETNPAGEWG
jgi:hypothetical protein